MLGFSVKCMYFLKDEAVLIISERICSWIRFHLNKNRYYRCVRLVKSYL